MNSSYPFHPDKDGTCRTILSQTLKLILGTASLLAFAFQGFAQPYSISWSSIDGGGVASSTNGTYTIGSTIGQPDAGELSGGSYRVVGGFWAIALSEGVPTPTPTTTPTPSATPTPGPGLDVDGDGFDDAYEILHGSNPNNPAIWPTLGDANNDGKTTILDALELSRSVLGKLTLSTSHDLDIDANGVVNMRDAEILYRWATRQKNYEVIPKP